MVDSGETLRWRRVDPQQEPPSNAMLREEVYVPYCLERRTKPNSAVLSALAPEAPQLSSAPTVSARNFLLGDRGVGGLLALLPFSRSLVHLDLSGNNLRQSGVQAVCSAVSALAPQLVEVSLAQNPIGPVSCGDLDLVVEAQFGRWTGWMQDRRKRRLRLEGTLLGPDKVLEYSVRIARLNATPANLTEEESKKKAVEDEAKYPAAVLRRASDGLPICDAEMLLGDSRVQEEQDS